jgi:hypothetical protein
MAKKVHKDEGRKFAPLPHAVQGLIYNTINRISNHSGRPVGDFNDSYLLVEHVVPNEHTDSVLAPLGRSKSQFLNSGSVSEDEISKKYVNSLSMYGTADVLAP